jgi:hypothetical protein
LKEKHESITTRYSWLSEISLYFIELVVYGYIKEARSYSYLKKALKTIDFHLQKEEVKECYWEKHTEININSILISDVIWKYIQLPQNLKRNIKCPFPDHKDKSASFRIYEDSNRFHCFWCNKNWDGVNFISYMENYSNKEAFKIFINLYLK